MTKFFEGQVANLYAYVKSNPLTRTDPLGLFDEVHHRDMTASAVDQEKFPAGDWLIKEVPGVDFQPHSQDADYHSNWHAMCAPGQAPEDGSRALEALVGDAVASCNWDKLAIAMHAVQDSAARGHKGCQIWDGHVSFDHLKGDVKPTKEEVAEGTINSRQLLQRFKNKCLNSQ